MTAPLRPGRLIWVSLPHATFGLIVSGGRVVDAPPIARRSVGRPERDVADYFRARGARFVPCDLPNGLPRET